MKKKVILEVDETNMVYDKDNVYIGTMNQINIVDYIEAEPIAETTLALVKAGVAPADIIDLKRNDLI